MMKRSYHMYGVCEDCCIRNCKKTPKKVDSALTYYTCPKYRKRVEGWKLKEVIEDE